MSLYRTEWRELGSRARSRFLIGKIFATFLLYKNYDSLQRKFIASVVDP
jgi:hypothetical protein